jgi:hypothetical protein
MLRKVLRVEPAQAERDRIIRSAYEMAPILEPASRSFSRAEENLGAMLLQIHCVVFLAWAKTTLSFR